jgi:hypothetical protein
VKLALQDVHLAQMILKFVLHVLHTIIISIINAMKFVEMVIFSTLQLTNVQIASLIVKNALMKKNVLNATVISSFKILMQNVKARVLIIILETILQKNVKVAKLTVKHVLMQPHAQHV